jgi:hypothetical protein
VLEELDGVEDISDGMRSRYTETANIILGVREKGQKPWISRNSWKLVEERKHLKQIINSRFERVKSKVKSSLFVLSCTSSFLAIWQLSPLSVTGLQI